jgi:hypothetical protein
VLGQAGAVLVTWKVWDYNIDPSSVALECPSCGCPHSWVMISKHSIVTGKSTTTTTETYVRESDGDTRRYESKKINYTGESTYVYKCINCNHERRTHDKNISFGSVRPIEGPQEFPFEPVWRTGMSKRGKIIFVIVAIIIALTVLSNIELPFLERLPILGNE